MTDIYTKFIANAMFPLHEKLKGHNTVAVCKEMEHTQWYSVEKIKALQLSRLKVLLTHVESHVPYYQRTLKKLGITAADINDLSDLARFPFLDKKNIRGNIDDLKADNAQSLSRFNTGGSSGEPLIFFIGKERVSHDVAAKWRATRWWDVDIGDKEIVVWGSPIELGKQDRIKIFRDKILRTNLVPAFDMSEKRLEEYISVIQHIKPRMLFGYPSSLSLIASYAEKRHIQMADLGIKVAFVTSERLYDDQRIKIESVFGCPVANGYGGRDAGFIAHQCPSGGMHITAEDIIVEIVDSDGKVLPPGQSGEIVTTHLATNDFPFIRYRTGDVGVISEKPCICGRGLPLLEEIQGRTTDFVIASDGTVMHGLALIYIVRDIKGVNSFKITQESLYETHVQIAVDSDFDKNNYQQIINGLKKRLGQNVEVLIEEVDAVAREKSGKFRYIVSKVNPF